MKLHCIAFALVIIGALNWGLIGLGGSSWNLVNLILGQWPMVENLVYILVGLSAIALVFSHKKDCATCGACKPGASNSAM